MKKVIIIRWSEIHLKGKNRKYFELLLEDNIKRSLKNFQYKFTKILGRYLIENFNEIDESDIINKKFGLIENMLALRQEIVKNKYIAISLRPQILEIAAAIYNNNEIAGAVAVYIPECLISENDKENLIKEICEIASQISERI